MIDTVATQRGGDCRPGFPAHRATRFR